MSKLLYKNHTYTLKELLLLNNKSPLYKEGEVEDMEDGEVIDINDLRIFREKYISELISKKHKDNILLNIDKNDKLVDLEEKYNNGDITIDELNELILLKYGKKIVNINYKTFIKLNNKVPDLSDSDLGKFYKVLMLLSHKANTLLRTKNIKSNPVTKEEISKILGVEIKATERFLNRLKNKHIVKSTIIDDKIHLMINPIYAFNGNSFNGSMYIHFKNELSEISDIPEELKLLWEYEITSCTII